MSANARAAVQGSYINVYQKGALIGMCIDIIIREKNGEKGILDLMQNYLLSMVFQRRLMTTNF
jgi:predicted metalloprotease with PDZ domain